MNLDKLRKYNDDKDYAMITICVGMRNRTSNLLDLISSMKNCTQRDRLALSVFDCKSTDVEDLKTTIEKAWKGKLVFRSEERTFTCSYSCNQAISQAETNKIFICDADMTLPVDFVEQYDKFVDKNTAWFPICYSLFENKRTEIAEGNGWWRDEGHKMAGILKENFEQLGGFNLDFIGWGGEDDDLFLRAHIDFKVIRNKSVGLFHKWHPPDKEWGGRDLEENLPELYKDHHLESAKGITSISRELLLSYVAGLIYAGRRSEARRILTKNFSYPLNKRWFKLWVGSWIPELLLKSLTSKQ